MNHISISGRLTSDPTIRKVNTSQGELDVCNFTIASNDFNQMKDRENKPIAQFFRVTLWREQALRANEWLKKGSFVIAEGAVNLVSYTGTDGVQRANMELSNARVDYGGTARLADSAPRAAQPNYDAPAPVAQPAAPAAQPAPAQTAQPAPADTTVVTDDDLPF